MFVEGVKKALLALSLLIASAQAVPRVSVVPDTSNLSLLFVVVDLLLSIGAGKATQALSITRVR